MSRSRTLRSTLVGRRSLALTTALVAGGILLAAPSARHVHPVLALTVAQAWPQAQSALTPADLPDGTAYQPEIFLTAGDSVGTAPTRDGKIVRILLRRSDGTDRQLHRLPAVPTPPFPLPPSPQDFWSG